MKTYSETEILNLYRNNLGLSRLLTLPAQNERQPLDRELLDLLHSRYRTLLATEDPDLLPVEDVGKQAILSADYDAGMLTIQLPDSCIRPVSLHLPGWRQEVYQFRRAGSTLHRNQRFALLRASCVSPLVFRSADRLMAYGLPPAYRTVDGCSLRAVAAPAGGSFRIDESLLPLLVNN